MKAEERLFNLLLALAASREGLTKRDILDTVVGYQDGAVPSSLDRRFERDKDVLRSLGVSLLTVDDPAAPGDNQRMRYRIDDTSLLLPDDVDFDDEQLALLALAGMVWQQESGSAQARRGLTKLRGLLPDVDLGAAGAIPAFVVGDQRLAELRDAAAERKCVEFGYAAAQYSTALQRRVWPLAVVSFHGQWYMQGWDETVEGVRTFLLRRILGTISSASLPRSLPSALEEPDRGWAHACLRELQSLWDEHVATLIVVPKTEAATRLHDADAKGGGDSVTVHYTDEVMFADELCSFGDEVRVIAPDSLRDAVTDRLRRVLEAHRD